MICFIDMEDCNDTISVMTAALGGNELFYSTF